MDKLTAEEYREALALVLAELRDLDARQPLEVAERVGRLQAHLATIVGERDPGDAIYGLQVLRAYRAEREAASPPPPLRPEDVGMDPQQLRWRPPDEDSP